MSDHVQRRADIWSVFHQRHQDRINPVCPYCALVVQDFLWAKRPEL